MTKAKTAVRFAVFFCFLFLLIPLKAKAAEILTGDRLSGLNRYETSVSISNTGWSGGSSTAIITTGGDFSDALCAAPLAKMYNAPILLTSTNNLNADVSDELDRLGVSRVYIVGGTGAVSANIESQLKSKGISYTRLSGTDRYGTSIAVANVLGVSGKLVVATGENYPDALSIASWAASNGAPIILTQSKSIPANTAEYLKSVAGDISTTYVIGGAGVVSDAVKSKFKNPIRVGGQDRYGTNLAVLKSFKDNFDFGKVYIATGNQFPDALSGSALAAQSDSPIILTGSSPLSATESFIGSVSGSLKSAYVLGGTGAVSDSAVSKLVPPIIAKFSVSVPAASIFAGNQEKAAANITMIPANAVKPDVTFSVADQNIISINSSGTITALNPGVTTLTAAALGETSSIQIAVKLNKVIVLDPGHGGYSSGATVAGRIPEKTLNLEIADKLKAKLLAQGYTVVMTRDDDTFVSLEDRVKVANDLNADLFISIHNNASDSTVSGTETCYSMYRPSEDTSGVYVKAGSDGANVYNLSGAKIGVLSAGKTAAFIKEDAEGIHINYNGTEGIVSIDDVWVGDSTPCADSLRSQALAQKIDDEVGSLGPVGWERCIKDDNLYVTRYTNCPSVLVEAGFITNSYDYSKISDSTFQDEIAGKITDAVVWYFANYK